ncbi:hypothetical protein LWC35_11485 [Pseudonocardia kujensis]|uniref:hypothetical protein n=1 Tax=Pseudonocardia kujensis TaxID=1128675 RepID=UPI001E329E13|nr:hypothetical protein [Pseudonocardia kujensis]MCE0763519.1 hypothetical protein [Pseudonocardia kujensis]
MFLTPDAPSMVGDEPPHALAVAVHAAWAELARTGEVTRHGSVPWKRYATATRTVLAIDREPVVLRDPDAELAEAWGRVLRYR